MVIYDKYRYVQNPEDPGTFIEFLTLEEAVSHKENNGNVGQIFRLLQELVG